MSKNLFEGIPKDVPEELFQEIVNNKNIKIERIISKGHITPNGEWYDQEQNEWVLVLRGAGKIFFKDDGREELLQQGEHCLIPAHCKHRVSWTDANFETIWLAVHFNS